MLKKKIGKIVTASMVSACMLANTAVTILPSISLTASAGEMLGQTNFDNGVGLPWHVCESGPAKLKFNIDNGSYNITIVNEGGADEGGESRWDCQFRHRGLEIVSGNNYTVHAEITSSETGQIYSKIGDLSGKVEVWHNNCGDSNFGSTWDCMSITANQTLVIDATFTATTGIEVAEWAFHFGGSGQYQAKDCLPAGTVLQFDNMSLYNNTTDQYDYQQKATPEKNDIRVNQVGYFTNLTKKATLAIDSTTTTAQAFTVVNEAGTVVYEGVSENFGDDSDSGDYVHILDFSDLTEAGTYTIKCGDSESYPFTISDTVYDGILTDAVNYYYQNRSGIAIEDAYITSEDKVTTATLAHQAGHNPDTAYIQTKWVKSYLADGSNVEKSSSLTATGGWYDAGDHGKYVVNGGISVWTLNNIYERALSGDNNSDVAKWADASGTVVVPEAGNGNPDILDETRVELEWMFKMIVGSGYSMTYELEEGGDTGEYTNMVYHKMHDHKWTGLACRPYDYVEEWKTIRIVKPPSTAATLNLVAAAAQASRLWQDYDSTFADLCLANAKKCYEAAKANPELYAPLDQAIGGGAYGDTEVRDDFYWAACELYAATGDSTYYTDLKSYSDAFGMTTNLTGGENKGSFSSFNWGCTAGLGSLTLLLNEDKLTAAEVTELEANVISAADAYTAKEDAQGYGIPYESTTYTDAINLGYDDNGNLIEVTGYEWGSNSFVVNNAIVMAYAYDLTGEIEYINGVSTAMDYVFGRNALDFSYVTGYGSYHCENPHHRYWSYELDKSFPMAPDGVMSGGANSGMQDPYIKGAGYKLGEIAPQLCYIDSIESWSTNEVTINWNAPFAWVVSFLEDEAPYVDEEKTTTSTTEGETTTTTTTEVEANLYGDVNVDGDVTVSDIILLARYLAEDTTVEITDQGYANADCEYDSYVTTADLSQISRYLVHLITLDQLGPQ